MNENVWRAQKLFERLRTHHRFATPEITVDGIFGPRTKHLLDLHDPDHRYGTHDFVSGETVNWLLKALLERGDGEFHAQLHDEWCVLMQREAGAWEREHPEPV